MRYKDILTEEEDNKLQELKMDLFDAPNEKVRNLILAEINEIFETAKQRYYSMLDGNKEQAAAVQSNEFPAIHFARYETRTNQQAMQ